MFDLENLITVRPCYPKRPKDFSIIIPHRGDPMGLWLTVSACEAALEECSYSYEYRIVLNGMDVIPTELIELRDALSAADKIGEFIHHVAPLSPPSARQMATEEANGEYLFFFDNHCIPQHNYFTRALHSMREFDMDVVHSVIRYQPGLTKLYHYELILESDFWGRATQTRHYEQPYRCALAGHGAFAAKRSAWEEVGGYGPIGLFQGFAGEESYFDFKLQLLGKTSWFDPNLDHYHYATNNRGYVRHYNYDFYRNLLMASYVIGDDRWLEDTARIFQANTERVPEMIAEVRDWGTPHKEWIAAHQVQSFDEFIRTLDDKHIAH